MTDHEERQAAEQARRIAAVELLLATPLALNELKVTAKYRRLKYEAHVAAGFNPGQALYLCTLP